MALHTVVEEHSKISGSFRLELCTSLVQHTRTQSIELPSMYDTMAHTFDTHTHTYMYAHTGISKEAASELISLVSILLPCRDKYLLSSSDGVRPWTDIHDKHSSAVSR